MHAKDVPILGASFGAYSGWVLDGSLNECVLEGRVLFSSSELVSVMDAGS